MSPHSSLPENSADAGDREGKRGSGASYEEKFEALAKIYSRRKLRLAVLHIVIAAAYLLVMLFVFTDDLAASLEGVAQRHFAASNMALVILYTFFFFLFYRLVSFPLHYEADYRLEHRFMLSTETFPQWLWRDIKAFLLSQVVLVILVLLFYYFLRATGDRWWLYAAGAYILFAVVIGRLFPVAIVPLFFKRSELANPTLVERLTRLAKRARFRISKVYSFDLSRQTRKANAALVGLGGTKQILLADTLLARFTVDEIEAVFAHEIGHHVHNHLLRLLIFGSVLSVVAFYVAHVILALAAARLGFEDPAGIATLPLFVLILAGFAFVVRPITNAYSRRLETESDAYAVRATNADSLVSALKKLARTNLADRNPGRLVEMFFYDHPSLDRRIARVRRLEEEGDSAAGGRPE